MPPSHHLQQCHKLQLLTFSLRNHFRRKRMEANVCHEKKKRIYKICHTSLTFFPTNLSLYLTIWTPYEVAILRIVSELWDNIVITNYLFYLLFFPWQKHINIIFISKTFCFRKNCVFCLCHRIKIVIATSYITILTCILTILRKVRKKGNLSLTIIYLFQNCEFITWNCNM